MWSTVAGAKHGGQDEAVCRRTGAQSATHADFPGREEHQPADRAGGPWCAAAQVPGLCGGQPAHAGSRAGARRRRGDHGVGRHLPLLRGASSRPRPVRTRRPGDGAGRDVEPASRAAFAVPGVTRFSQLASGHEGDGGAAGPRLGRGQQAAHPGIHPPARYRVEASCVCRRRRILDRGHYRPGRRRFHEAGEACSAGRVHQTQTLARRRFRAAERVGLSMRLTIVGSGDAFGSGGRFNTCFFLESAKGTLLVDCGATSLVGLKAHGLDPNRIDGIVLSHLHGDHFGALPFLLLDAQFLAQRERPLLIAGPPGTRARLDAALEVFFPRSTANKWRFSWKVMEIEVGRETEVLGHSVSTTEVVHYSGAPSTALRLSDGKTMFAYSGDTEWVDALVSVADGADLFIVECYGYSGHMPGHLSWEGLEPRLPDLRARRIMLTHMSPLMLAHLDQAGASVVLVAEDGAVLEF